MSRKSVISIDSSSDDNESDAPALPGTAKLRVGTTSLENSINGGPWTAVGNGTNLGWISVKDFGAKGDGVTDDWAAIDAAIRSSSTTILPAGGTIYFPAGTYVLSKTLEVSRCVALRGAGRYGVVDPSSLLRFASGVHGIAFMGLATSTDGGRSDGASIEDIGVAAVSKSGFRHGITIKAPNVRVLNVLEAGFSGDGLHVNTGTTTWAASTGYMVGDVVTNGANTYSCVSAGTSAASGGPTGTGTGPLNNGIVDGTVQWRYFSSIILSDSWRAEFCAFENNGNHGIFTQGGDANIGSDIQCQVLYNGGWGVYEDSFLGNYHEMTHADGNTLGPFRATGANASNVFMNCYSEGGQPAALINYPSMVINGLHGAGITGTFFGIINGRTYQFGFFDDVGNGVSFGYTNTVNTLERLSFINGALDMYRKLPVIGATYEGCSVWNWANLANAYGHGFAVDQGVFSSGLVRSRWLPPGALFTAPEAGFYSSGHLITHSDDPTACPGRLKYFAPGDLVFKINHALGGNVGWVCTVAGTNGTYSEGRTATSAGGTTLTLSAATAEIHVGDKIVVNGSTVYVTAITHNQITLTVSGAVGAGAGFAIAYSPPTFVSFGVIPGAPGNSTGTPGNATLNTTNGRSAIAAGANNIVITNSLVTATSLVFAQLATIDATLTSVPVCVPAAGSFTIYGNANATAAVNVGWEIR